MMSDSETQHQEIVDQEDGLVAGISLAYNIGTDENILAQALESHKNKNQFYLDGMMEGFALIIARKKYVRQGD